MESKWFPEAFFPSLLPEINLSDIKVVSPTDQISSFRVADYPLGS